MWKFFCAFLCLFLFHSVYSQTIQTNTPTTFCEGGQVVLSVSGATGTPSYQWIKDGANIATATQSTYAAKESGSYSVQLNNNNALTAVVVTVHPKPVVSFTFNNDNACSGTAIQFSSSVTTGTAPYKYKWDFGDGEDAATANPTHRYTSFGCGTQAYTVQLTVTDANGCATTTSRQITVKQVPGIDMRDLSNPFSEFNNCTRSPSTTNPNFTVQLGFRTASPACATSYTVNWGDGNTQTGLTAASFPLTHTYAQMGTFDLIVTATGSNGCSYSKTYKVINQSNPAVGISTPGSTTGCAPIGFWFKLKGYETNSPGTTYTWDFGDDTPPIVWTTPVAVDSIFHTFSKSSCPKPGSQFVVKVTATNGCKSTTATVDNITVYQGPQADFTTPPSGCVNKSIAFTNTTIGGYNEGTCERTTLYAWDFGDPTSSQNTSTATNPSHIYTKAGTYTVTLIAEGSCGKDTITKTVCIVSTPVASFTLDKADACSPSVVTATNTSSTLSDCTDATYQWTVSYSPTTCSSGSGWTFANNTTASSVHPAFSFTKTGKYTITLSVTNGCGTVVSSKEVLIKAPPTVSLPAIQNTCGPLTITPVVNVTNCGTGNLSYSWVIDGGSPITTQNPGPLTFSTPGQHSISVTVTNECGSATDTKTFTISSLADLAVPTNQVFCHGQTAGPYTFSSSTPGATIGWTATPASTATSIGMQATSGSNAINAFAVRNTTAAPLTATITVSATANGCTQTSTFSIVVNPQPQPPTVTNIFYCQDATATPLTATATSGNTLLWYTAATGGTGSATAPTPSTATIGSVPYYVSQQHPTTGCESSRATLTVTTGPIPAIGSASGINPTNCGSTTGSMTLTGLSASTPYSVRYARNGVISTNNFTSTAAGNIIITGLRSGTYTDITVSANGCTSTAAGPISLSDPNPPSTPVITAPATLCSGQTLSLSASSSTSGTTYSWSGPNNFSSQAQSPTLANVTTAASGTYTVTATVNGCTSPAASADVLINATPVISTAESNSPLCTVNDLSLKATTTTSGTVSWAWTGPNSFTSAEQNPSIPSVTTAHAGNYTVTAMATNGCQSLPKTVPVVVNPTPTISTATATDPLTCNTATGSIVLNGLTAGNAYTVRYTKSGTPVSATLTANASGNVLLSGLTAGLYTNISVTAAGCPSNEVGPFTLTDPTPPATPIATSNGPICEGSTVTLAASTGIPGAISYTWSGPNGFTSTLSSPTIPNASLGASGTYRVTAMLNGCTSAAGTVDVVVNPTPAALVVTSNAPVCAGSPIELKATTTFTGNLSYVWSGPNGFTSNEQNPRLTNTTPSFTGTYSVVATTSQGACPSPAGSVQVIVYPLLENTINTAAQSICYSQPVTISGTPAAGGNGAYTYQWEKSTDNNTWVAIVGQTGPSLTYTPEESVYLRRSVQSGPCVSNSLSAHVVVQPPVSNNTVKDDQAVCSNTAAGILVGTVPSGASGSVFYQWEQSTDGGSTWTEISGATAKDYNPGVLALTTHFRRIVTTDLCAGPQKSTSNVVIVTLRPDAEASFLPVTTRGCPPFQLTPDVINLQPFPEKNGDYQWYANGVLLGSSATFPGYTLSQEDDSVTIMLRAVSLYGCRNGSVSHLFSTPKLPHPSFTISDSVGCGPLAVQVQNTTPDQSLFSYQWDFGNGQTSTLPQPAAITFSPNPAYSDTVYRVTLKVFSICDTVTVTRDIRVKSKPKALFTPTKTTGCSPMKVSFRNTSLGDNSTYFWDFGDGTTLSTTNRDTVEHTFITGIVDTFYVRLKAVNDCGSDSLTYALVVTPNSIRLNVAVNGPERFGCGPHPVSFVNNSRGASLFQWNFGDGTTTTTTKNIDTVRHTYLTPGSYTVTLNAINNCSDTTTTQTIVVYPTPTAAFTAQKYTLCIGDTARFSNLSSDATAYRWIFGDGNVSTLASPSHVYRTEGTYTVSLVAFRDNASGNVCTDSSSQTITVTRSQTGSFTLSSAQGTCAPFTVTVVNQNRPSVSATWDFGDGTTATGDSIVHTYQIAGTFQVTLSVRVPGGCTYQSTKPVTVQGPKGTLLYKGGTVCYPAAVQLQAVATGATSYEWDFGDGTVRTTTEQTVFHTYRSPGSYLPRVILQNGSCRVPLTGVDTIKVDRVDAGFTVAKTEVCGSTTLRFSDTTHAFSGVKSIHWNFGDNTSSTALSPEHTYYASGRYAVQMLVTSNSGCTDTITRVLDITVKSKPVVSIAATDTGCSRNAIAFNALIQTVDPTDMIQWNLSNGASGTGPLFTHTFTQTGAYDIRLIVGTRNGCFDTADHSIQINPSPVVAATPSLNLCRGNSVPLTAIGAATWQWSPLQGLSCYTCPNPIASPTQTTPYVVEGRNSFGCTDRDTVNVVVIQPLKLMVSPNDSICIGSSTNLLVQGGTAYNWSPAQGLSSTSISNPTAAPAVTTTYRVVGYDGFNCFTDTAFVTVAVGLYPTVNVGPDLVLATGTRHPLASTITNGPIASWAWSPSSNLSCSTCPVPTAEIKKDISYTVNVTTPYGCAASDTLNIKVFCEQSQVYIPNAFTPDGDGINDLLLVRSKGVATVKFFRIFNRWGELVFEKSNFSPNDPTYAWDGRIRGVIGGPDVFVYTCEVLCENGTPYTFKGNVSIIK